MCSVPTLPHTVGTESCTAGGKGQEGVTELSGEALMSLLTFSYDRTSAGTYLVS